MVVAYFLYGIFAGYFAGFLGIGAGCLLMPFFILVGIPYQTAVDASLMSVFLSSLTSSIQNLKHGDVPWVAIISMVIPGALFAILGNVVLIHHIPPIFLEILYAGVMFMNVDLLRWSQRKNESKNLSSVNHIYYLPLYIFIGSLSGLTASLLGIGGGIFIISLLVGVAHYSVKDAVKVAISVMVVTTLFGLTSEIFTNTLPFAVGIPTALGAIVGCFFGTIALKYVKQDMILKTNYTVSLSLGFIMLCKALLNSL